MSGTEGCYRRLSDSSFCKLRLVGQGIEALITPRVTLNSHIVNNMYLENRYSRYNCMSAPRPIASHSSHPITLHNPNPLSIIANHYIFASAIQPIPCCPKNAFLPLFNAHKLQSPHNYHLLTLLTLGLPTLCTRRGATTMGRAITTGRAPTIIGRGPMITGRGAMITSSWRTWWWVLKHISGVFDIVVRVGFGIDGRLGGEMRRLRCELQEWCRRSRRNRRR